MGCQWEAANRTCRDQMMIQETSAQTKLWSGCSQNLRYQSSLLNLASPQILVYYYSFFNNNKKCSPLRREISPHHHPRLPQEKLYSDAENPKRTAVFVRDWLWRLSKWQRNSPQEGHLPPLVRVPGVNEYTEIPTKIRWFEKNTTMKSAKESRHTREGL